MSYRVLRGGKFRALLVVWGLTLSPGCSAPGVPSQTAPPERLSTTPGASASTSPPAAAPPDASARCEAGEAQACFQRGEELVVGGDSAQGRGYFERACEGRAGDGCAGLAVLLGPNPDPVDERRQVELYQKGCALASPRACTGLATLHLEGKLVERNAARALELYRGACEAKLAVACYLLGRHELSGAALPGGRPDPAAGNQHLEQACTLGLKRACEPL